MRPTAVAGSSACTKVEVALRSGWAEVRQEPDHHSGCNSASNTEWQLDRFEGTRMAAENYLGFDPGGQTGVALLTVQGGRRHCKTACVDSVDAALSCATSLLDGKTPEAAGVDTFLFWEPTIGGWRRADRWLRDRYPEVLNSVLASNSTAGAMAVQGMGLAIRLRERWPQIELIEPIRRFCITL